MKRGMEVCLCTYMYIILCLVMLAFGTGLGHVYDITPSPGNY